MFSSSTARRSVAVLSAALSLTPAAFAQHHSFIHRHPTVSGIGAGVATHHALKVAARNAKRHHKKLNWAERHPTLSAIGAGMATHHYGKTHN